MTKASQGSQVKSVWGPQEEEGQTEPLGIQGRRVTLVLGPPAQQADKGPQGKKVLLGLQVIWGHRVHLEVLEHLGQKAPPGNKVPRVVLVCQDCQVLLGSAHLDVRGHRVQRVRKATAAPLVKQDRKEGRGTQVTQGRALKAW